MVPAPGEFLLGGARGRLSWGKRRRSQADTAILRQRPGPLAPSLSFLFPPSAPPPKSLGARVPALPQDAYPGCHPMCTRRDGRFPFFPKGCAGACAGEGSGGPRMWEEGHGDLSFLTKGPASHSWNPGSLSRCSGGGQARCRGGSPLASAARPPAASPSPVGAHRPGQDAGEVLWLCLGAAAGFAVPAAFLPHLAAPLISSPNPWKSGAQSQRQVFPGGVFFSFLSKKKKSMD